MNTKRFVEYFVSQGKLANKTHPVLHHHGCLTSFVILDFIGRNRGPVECFSDAVVS